ncbi:MAG: T9SS type A sorting domain-containing protein [Bacteroidales bacterium]|nr:T9SS type A sorting domain-containing protein [Bacteroidales bacterium]
MKYYLLVAVTLIVVINSVEAIAQGVSYTDDCEFVWSQGILGESIGDNSMFTGDIDSDGMNEMVLGAANYWGDESFWYILKYDPLRETYIQDWVSPIYSYNSSKITAIDVFNIDSDNALGIAVGFDNGFIEVRDGLTKKVEFTLQLPVSYPSVPINRILFEDINNDSKPELFCCNKTTTFIYSFPNLELVKQLDYGGLDMRCGNVNSDSFREIVYSDGDVIRLSSDTYDPSVVWKFFWPQNSHNGFVRLSDIDSDGKSEIIHAIDYSLSVYDAELMSRKFKKEFEEQIDAVYVADTDNDGQIEILVAEDNANDIWCFDKIGTEKWRIGSLGDGVTEINVADTDNDGQIELLWSSGSTSTAIDYIYIYSLPDLTQEWISQRIDPPYVAVKIADTDNDGRDEIVTLTNENEGYQDGGFITIFDAETHAFKWRSQPSLYHFYDLEIMDIDKDNQSEIVVVGESDRGYIQILNGSTYEIETDTFVNNTEAFTRIDIIDIDNNGTFEYILAEESIVYVLNSEFHILLKSNDSHFQGFYEGDLLTGNIDDDDNIEIINLFYGNISCFDGITYETWSVPESNWSACCLYDLDKDGIMELIACDYYGKVGYIDLQTGQLVPFNFMMKNQISNISLVEIPGKVSPLLTMISDTKLYFSDIEGRMSVPLPGDYHARGFELSDYNHDSMPEIFVVSKASVTEFQNSCYLMGDSESFTPENLCNIYPNPSHDKITIEIKHSISTIDATAEIYSMIGIKFASINLEMNKTQLDISSLNAGIYVVRIIFGSKQFIQKIIKK